jgi:zinc transport system permease protein
LETLLDIPVRLLHDFQTYPFWRNAVLGGLMVAAVCSLLSVYVVLRRMAFIGQGISHSALGGFALGVLIFGAGPAAALKVDATALIFCLAVAALIAITTRHSKISEDSAIGIYFVGSMALGAVFFRMAPGYSQDIYSYLFGSILALDSSQLRTVVILAIVVAAPLLAFHKELLYYAFDEEMAGVSGVPVNFLHLLLLALLSITIIISARLVGILLVSAFLILPGATAQLATQRFNRMLVVSVVCGVLTTLFGLAVSSVTDWPSGAAIVLVQVALFSIMFAWRKFQGTLSV